MGVVELKKNATADDKKNARPPVILFVWGRFSFQGVVTSLTQKYTMFLSDGTPVRAECAVTIHNVNSLESTTISRPASTRTPAPARRGAKRSHRSHRLEGAGRRRTLGGDRRLQRHRGSGQHPRHAQDVAESAGGLIDGRSEQPERRLQSHRSPLQSIVPTEVHDLFVESDLDQPDHAQVTLSNQSTKCSEKVNEGDDVEIVLGLSAAFPRPPSSRARSPASSRPTTRSRACASTFARSIFCIAWRAARSRSRSSRSPTRTSSTRFAKRTA